jgi:hypothetical protein
MGSSPPVEDIVQSRFHTEYDGARRSESLDVPVVVVMAEEVVLVHRGGVRVSRPLTSGAVGIIKAGAHFTVAVYAACYRVGHARLSELRALERESESLAGSVSTFFVEPALEGASRNLTSLLSMIRAYLLRVLEEGRGDTTALEKFAREAGPLLLRCTEDATRVQLATLHAQVAPLLGLLDAGERRALQVIVLGDHQARVRSLGMQYFQKLLREAPGQELRVTYGEGISTIDGALRLVGTRLLDRVLANAFFGDPTRLQRDILGDAVKEQLAGFELAPLDSVA